MTHSTWTNPEAAGYLPHILQADDPRPAAGQLADRYAHGGGYTPYPDGDWTYVPGDPASLHYPGDPPFYEISRTVLPLSGQLILLFQYSILAIVELDGSFAVTRAD